MSPRDPDLRLQDIAEAIDRIFDYTASHSLESFAADRMAVDAVVRNFEVIGEAARHVDAATATRLADIPWQDIATFATFSSTNTSASASRSSGKPSLAICDRCARRSGATSNGADRQGDAYRDRSENCHPRKRAGRVKTAQRRRAVLTRPSDSEQSNTGATRGRGRHGAD